MTKIKINSNHKLCMGDNDNSDKTLEEKKNINDNNELNKNSDNEKNNEKVKKDKKKKKKRKRCNFCDNNSSCKVKLKLTDFCPITPWNTEF